MLTLSELNAALTAPHTVDTSTDPRYLRALVAALDSEIGRIAGLDEPTEVEGRRFDLCVRLYGRAVARWDALLPPERRQRRERARHAARRLPRWEPIWINKENP
jgi:hypothetical protein